MVTYVRSNFSLPGKFSVIIPNVVIFKALMIYICNKVWSQYLNFLFISFSSFIIYIFYIPITVFPPFSSPTSSLYSHPVILCLLSLLRWGKASYGNQQRMADEAESGPGSSPLHQGWTSHPAIGNRFQSASSWIRNRTWSHCQGPHKSLSYPVVTQMQRI